MVFVFLIIIIRSLYYFFFLNFGLASGDVLVNNIPLLLVYQVIIHAITCSSNLVGLCMPDCTPRK
jgi:hypothetical protein